MRLCIHLAWAEGDFIFDGVDDAALPAEWNMPWRSVWSAPPLECVDEVELEELLGRGIMRTTRDWARFRKGTLAFFLDGGGDITADDEAPPEPSLLWKLPNRSIRMGWMDKLNDEFGICEK